MGWTERKEVLTDYEGMIAYLDTEDAFHDCRIGNLDYDGTDAHITVEEPDFKTKYPHEALRIWDFHFRKVLFFELSIDIVMGAWIFEVERGERRHEVVFNLTSGQLCVAAERIELGIPS